MNPIEHVWMLMKRSLRSLETCPKTLVELKNTLEEIWNGIEQSFIQRLIDSMPDRIEALVKVGGKQTKY